MVSTHSPVRARLMRVAMVLAVLALATSCVPRPSRPDGLYAIIRSARGDIVISLAFDRTPLAAANFAGLAAGTLEATGGRHFYDGLKFHRVEPGFVVQTGDPAGDGSGDPGYNFPDEFDASLGHDGPGVVAMANYGPDTNGSQFYITLAAAQPLDGLYTVFGRVVEGMEVVQAIQQGDVIESVTIEAVGPAAKNFRYDQQAWNDLYAPVADAAHARVLARRAEALEGIRTRWPQLEPKPDGFMSVTLEPGSGDLMRRGYTVQVQYKGMLPDGTVFDQSVLHGGPFSFELGTGQVIPGWDRVVLEMRKGEKRLVAIPPEFAYGSRGAAGIIPPNSFLVFEMEVVGYEP